MTKLCVLELLSNDPVLIRAKSPGRALRFLRLVLLDLGVEVAEKTESSELMCVDIGMELCWWMRCFQSGLLFMFIGEEEGTERERG